MNSMVEYMTLGEMFDELLQEYIERNHEEEDFDSANYESFLETCSDDDFLAEYNRVFGDA